MCAFGSNIISNTTFVPGQEKSADAETEKLPQDEVLQAVPEDATAVSLQISLMRVSALFNGMPFLSMANAVSTQRQIICVLLYKRLSVLGTTALGENEVHLLYTGSQSHCHYHRFVLSCSIGNNTTSVTDCIAVNIECTYNTNYRYYQLTWMVTVPWKPAQ